MRHAALANGPAPPACNRAAFCSAPGETHSHSHDDGRPTRTDVPWASILAGARGRSCLAEDGGQPLGHAGLDAAARAFDDPLGALGFERGVCAHDHVPAGRADDPRQWTKRFWSRQAHPGGDMNLHVRVTGSANERLALLFRDWFRAHPEAIPAYTSFKRSLAAVTPDLDAYSDVKDPVVDLVITVAETWATSTGWQP
jgi:hypothetical protein